MKKERDLKKEIKALGIVAMEDFEPGSRESAFAALDAIHEHNKQFPEEKLVQMMADARREASETMAGIRGRKGEN